MALGCCEQTVYRYERGEQEPSLHTLRILAAVTGASLAWLVTGEGLGLGRRETRAAAACG